MSLFETYEEYPAGSREDLEQRIGFLRRDIASYQGQANVLCNMDIPRVKTKFKEAVGCVLIVGACALGSGVASYHNAASEISADEIVSRAHQRCGLLVAQFAGPIPSSSFPICVENQKIQIAESFRNEARGAALAFGWFATCFGVGTLVLGWGARSRRRELTEREEKLSDFQGRIEVGTGSMTALRKQLEELSPK